MKISALKLMGGDRVRPAGMHWLVGIDVTHPFCTFFFFRGRTTEKIGKKISM